MRLLVLPPTPLNRFTRDVMEKQQQTEHVVLIGEYKNMLLQLLSEMREESLDYIQNVTCGRRPVNLP